MTNNPSEAALAAAREATRIKLDAKQRQRAAVLIEDVYDDPDKYAYEIIYLRDALRHIEALAAENAALEARLAGADSVIAYALGQGNDLIKRPEGYSRSKSDAIDRHRARRASATGEKE